MFTTFDIRNRSEDLAEVIPNPTRVCDDVSVKKTDNTTTRTKSFTNEKEFTEGRQIAIRNADVQYNNWRSWGRQDWALLWADYSQTISDPKLSNDAWMSVRVPNNTRNVNLLVMSDIEKVDDEGNKVVMKELTSPAFPVYNGFHVGEWSKEPNARGVQTSVPQAYRRPSLYQNSWRSGGNLSQPPVLMMSKEARQAYLQSRLGELVV